MAYLRWENCEICGKKFEAVDRDYTCRECHERKRREYMWKIRRGKSLEQRIEQIEEWIYGHETNNIN